MDRLAVYKAINAISEELAREGIGKERRNEQQKYKFRGIDDVLNSLSPLLAKHRLVIIPQVESREVTERKTANGGTLFYVVLAVRFQFVSAEDGSAVEVVTYGEAMDSGDKATNKAMSAAYKYAAILTFSIPTEGDNDADAHTPPPSHDTKQTRINRALSVIDQASKPSPKGQPPHPELNGDGIPALEEDRFESRVKAVMDALSAAPDSDALTKVERRARPLLLELEQARSPWREKLIDHMVRVRERLPAQPVWTLEDMPEP